MSIIHFCCQLHYFTCRKIKAKDLLSYIKQHHEKARTFAIYARQQQDKRNSQAALDMQNAINGVHLPALLDRGMPLRSSGSSSADADDGVGPMLQINPFKLGSTRKFS